MSFLKPHYEKPGKGVEKNEPQGPAFFRYFKLYFRNFSKMIGYGTVYFFAMLPLIVFAVYFILAVINPELGLRLSDALYEETYGHVVEEGKEVMANSWIALLMMVAIYVPRAVSIPLVILSAICIGPLSCGMVYCMRNHAREDHAWFSDLFTRAWRNKWQGLAFGLIDIALCLSLLVYLFAPDSMGMGSTVFGYLRILCIAIFACYMVMRWYIYQMIVTFTLKFRGLIKNAWMFVILGAGRNIATVLASLAMIFFFVVFPLYYPSAMPFFLLIMMFLLWSMLIFLAVFGTYPVMHKYLVAPALEEQRKAEAKKNGGKKTEIPEESPENAGDDDSILDDDD